MFLLSWTLPLYSENTQLESDKILLKGIGLSDPSLDELAGFIKGEAAVVENLIKQLDNNDYNKRNSTHKLLARLGTPAIPQLKAILKNGSAEVKIRAQNIIIEINNTENEEFLSAAIRLIGTAQNEQAAQILLEILRNDSLSVASLSAEELSRFPANPETQKALTQFNERVSDEAKKELFIWIDDYETINILDFSTKETKKLYTAPAQELTYALLSPNNVYIAFPTLKNEVTIIKTNGKGFRVVTEFPATDRLVALSWSPDSQKIAASLSGCNEPQKNGLYLADIKTGKNEKLADGDIYGQSYAPDGKRIAFSGALEMHYQIYIIDISTKQIERLSHHDTPDYFPEWSPNGNLVFFDSSEADTFFISPDGKNERKLVSGDSSFIRFAPDGNKIAFVSDKQILVLNLLDNKIKKLAIPRTDNSIFTQKWSRDSKKIIYTEEEEAPLMLNELVYPALQSINEIDIETGEIECFYKRPSK